MNLLKTFLIYLTTVLFIACSNGDKASIVGADFGDASFINDNFAGNKINYEKIGNPCELLNSIQIAKLYGASSEKVMIDRSNELGGQKSCRFLVSLSDQEFDHLTGFIAIAPEISADNDPGGIAEATGGGTEWIEAWELKKMLSKSSEYIPNMGKAAIWFGAKRSLLIKLDGYSLSITAPGAAFNKKEKEKNRNYKAIAIEIAQKSGLL
ncbi:MAG: hypothetical protein NXI23_11890 [Bacteroidetes bacterium]|jgi:hypothetical protein|nr:hypothetical protein [Bacteroidota bacterium]MDF1865439.1 hypothetical protein [Saprospiraceae bacterium]